MYGFDGRGHSSTNQNGAGVEVRIVRKIKSSSTDAKAYESSGVLKFLGEALVILIESY